jgi:hypothetical protein
MGDDGQAIASGDEERQKRDQVGRDEGHQHPSVVAQGESGAQERERGDAAERHERKPEHPRRSDGIVEVVAEAAFLVPREREAELRELEPEVATGVCPHLGHPASEPVP